MIKKIWMFAALFVAIMIGFSIFIIQISGYNRVYSDEIPTTQLEDKTIMKCGTDMKCGTGKCGAAMMEELNETVH